MRRRRNNGFSTVKFILGVLITLVLLAGITVGICIHLALQDDYESKYSFYQSDDSLTYTVLKGAVFGKSFELNETQVNTWINDNIVKDNDNNIKNLRVYFTGDIAEMYARVNYWNRDFAVYSKVLVSLDTVSETISLKPYSAKIGNLPVPDTVLKDLIEKNMPQNDNMSVNDGEILIGSSYNFKIDELSFKISLKSIDIHDKLIRCQTNSLADDALNNLKEYIQSGKSIEKLKELFGSSFNPDSLKEILNFDNITGIEDIRDLDEIKEKIIQRFSEQSE